MDKIILVGGFNEIIELAESNSVKIVGIIDKSVCKFKNYKNLGNDNDAKSFDEEIKKIPLIISPDIPAIRRKLHNYYAKNNFCFTTLISKKSNISLSAKIDIGTVIQLGVNVSAEVLIGQFVKLNTNSNIMHNSIIGNYTTVAPNAVLLGNVIVGQNCYVGANATILPNIKICEAVTIGAGAVVTKNIDTAGIYIGIPAKLKKS